MRHTGHIIIQKSRVAAQAQQTEMQTLPRAETATILQEANARGTGQERTQSQIMGIMSAGIWTAQIPLTEQTGGMESHGVSMMEALAMEQTLSAQGTGGITALKVKKK